jgi:hypothetical protein
MYPLLVALSLLPEIILFWWFMSSGVLKMRKVETESHYLLLWAIRESTGSLARRLVIYSGNKHEGLVLWINQFQDDLGPTWVVHGQITTRAHFEMRRNAVEAEHEKWNSRLG